MKKLINGSSKQLESTYCSRELWSIQLCVQDGLVDGAPDPRQSNLQIVRGSHFISQILQRGDKLPPLCIQFRHAGQAAPHHIETIPHTGPDERQALAVRAVLHLHQGSAALLRQSGVFSSIYHFNAQAQGLAQHPTGPKRFWQLCNHVFRIVSKRIYVLPCKPQTLCIVLWQICNSWVY